jgi:hypothetical protein
MAVAAEEVGAVLVGDEQEEIGAGGHARPDDRAADVRSTRMRV